jgi:hypothetical protein
MYQGELIEELKEKNIMTNMKNRNLDIKVNELTQQKLN